MVNLSRILAGAVLALALNAGAASAMVCGKREPVISALKNNHQEEVQGLGVTDSGTGLVEIYVGPAPKRSFSVVITDKNMLSCLLLTGEGWESVADVVKGGL